MPIKRRADKVPPHLVIVVERLPSQFGGAPRRQPRSRDDAEHAADAEIGEIGNVQHARIERLADGRDESQALRA